jgi:hypothetical protein
LSRQIPASRGEFVPPAPNHIGVELALWMGRRNIMLVILAALFFGLIILGFTLLTLLPVVLVILAIGVYRDQRNQPVAAPVPVQLAFPTEVRREIALPAVASPAVSVSSC